MDMMYELWEIYEKYNPQLLEEPVPEHSIPATLSSSFISNVTSDTTQATPVPSSVPSPTISQIFYGLICKAVDKATIIGLDDAKVLYDTAYVEIMKAVENAMEMTVVDIKEDIVVLLNTAYRMFNVIIIERAKTIAEQNWEKRMRKKLKRTLRRADNFKGYETPPTPKSSLSSHESYRHAPASPCVCHPQFHYNRYPKDCFGIYLPRKEGFCDTNITLTPVASMTDLNDGKSNHKQCESTRKCVEPFPKTTTEMFSESDLQQHGEPKNTHNDKTNINKWHCSEVKTSCIVNKNEDDKLAVSPRNLFKERLSIAVQKNKILTEDEINRYTYADRLKMLTFVKKASLKEELGKASSKLLKKNISQEERKSNKDTKIYKVVESPSTRTQRREAIVEID